MTLDNEILDALEDLKYPGFQTIQDNVSLLTDLSTFSSIISWISKQLQRIESFESTVNPIKDETEIVSFKIELNSLLRELSSPLMDSDLSDSKTKLSLLNSLCGQLMASFMTYANRKSGSNESMTISMNESQTAKDLKYILITLGEKRKPPNNISPQVLFNTIKDLLKKKLSERNNEIEDSLLLPEGLNLSSEQWKCLESIQEELRKDYSIRRQMLLKRCDCTINSFTWRTDTNTDDMKEKIDKVIGEKRKQMTETSNVTIADALAARQSDCDSLINGVISKNATNCFIEVPDMTGMANKGLQQRIQTQELHKYRIGSVPDRGGRPHEQPKPPKETFTLQQFQRDNPQRGRGRGGNAGGRGGHGGGGGGGGAPPNLPQNTNRIQGSGWVQNNTDRYSGDNRRQNYQTNDGQQYRQQKDDYHQNSGYNQNYQQDYQQRSQQYHHNQQQQQHYQQNYNSNNQYYEQQYDKQSSHNYSDQSYDSRQYQNQRPYRGRGGSGGGGGGRRY